MSYSKLLSQIDLRQETIDAWRPYSDPHLLNQIQQFFRVETTYSSNALEGCTYSLSETKILLEDGLTAGGKPLSHALCVKGHAAAYDYMFKLLKRVGLFEDDILTMHGLLSGLENDATAGEYRKNMVFITGSKYSVSAPSKIQSQIQEALSRLDSEWNKLHPVILAARIHKDIAFIHPFGDGNGRVARLAMNTVLIQNGFLPVSIPLVRRNEYITALEAAHTKPKVFESFIASCQHEVQKDFIRLMSPLQHEAAGEKSEISESEEADPTPTWEAESISPSL